jgi:cyclopropane fatty-acyl-phospholipid synthase-like methyltransferase
MSKPFSQACENNKAPILEVIRQVFHGGSTVLEIGSYTTQHVRYFAEHLPGITWQPSDMPDSLSVMLAGLEGETFPNILPPQTLDVMQGPWPDTQVEGVFSANTLHIMSAEHVPYFFQGVGKVLQTGGRLCVYGPFRYQGNYTSDSNARFDEWLKERDPLSGIRDIETVNELATRNGLELLADHAMPANNQLLVWQKKWGQNTISI